MGTEVARQGRNSPELNVLLPGEGSCAARLGSRNRQHRLRSQLEVLLEAAAASGACSPAEAARLLREIGEEFPSNARSASSRRKRL